jgi:hypothetical protein
VLWIPAEISCDASRTRASRHPSERKKSEMTARANLSHASVLPSRTERARSRRPQPGQSWHSSRAWALYMQPAAWSPAP